MGPPPLPPRCHTVPSFSVAHNHPVAGLTLSVIMSSAAFASGTSYVRLSGSAACSNNVAGSADVLWTTGVQVCVCGVWGRGARAQQHITHRGSSAAHNGPHVPLCQRDGGDRWPY